MRSRRRIRQIDVDFLCLAVFGQRALPDDMAERIAICREGARGIADALDRRADIPAPGSFQPDALEAAVAVA